MEERLYFLNRQSIALFEKLEKVFNHEKYSFLREIDTIYNSSGSADVAKVLSVLLYEKDPLLFRHHRRIMKWSLLTMDELSFSGYISATSQLRATLFLAALFHDIGKMISDQELIMKKEPLTPAEWREIQRHPIVGSNIFSIFGKFQEVSCAIRHHHERYDGTGYPDGLKGKEIPLFSRIIAIADAYDSMTTERHYREKISSTAALEELRRCTSLQFDKTIVEHFIVMVERNEELAICQR